MLLLFYFLMVGVALAVVVTASHMLFLKVTSLYGDFQSQINQLAV